MSWGGPFLILKIVIEGRLDSKGAHIFVCEGGMEGWELAMVEGTFVYSTLEASAKKDWCTLPGEGDKKNYREIQEFCRSLKDAWGCIRSTNSRAFEIGKKKKRNQDRISGCNWSQTVHFFWSIGREADFWKKCF